MRFLRNMLGEQRKRALGTILSHAESNIYADLTPDQQQAFRDRVIRAINQYHDTCLDLLKSSVDDGSMTVNQEALALLARVDRKLGKE